MIEPVTTLRSAAVDAQTLAETCAAAMYARAGCAQATTSALVEIGPGRARLTMPVRRDMVNGHDICHGGMIFTLADTAFAYACNSGNHATVAAAATIDFAAPARLGDTLTAFAEERSRSGRTGVYDVAVRRQDSTLIALFRGRSCRIRGERVPGLAGLDEEGFFPGGEGGKAGGERGPAHPRTATGGRLPTRRA